MSELRAVDLEVLNTLVQMEFVAQGQAETWRARTETGDPVIVKIYRFEDASCWKGLELFRREIQVLEQLKHPGIPRYLWHKEVEVADFLHIYLVQECVEGVPLTNYRLRDGELDRIINGVLDILIYLQNFTPPVVHRDVKPSNIIVSPDRVFLVDFGAVQVVTPSDDGGSTVVGTSGYMPFEQLMGRAVPASDLYGLGMTLIELVTGKTPDLLAMTDMRPIWETQLIVPVTETQKSLIRKLIEPYVEDRTVDAKGALEHVQQKPQRSPSVRRPQNMKTEVSMWGDEVIIQTPGTNHAALAAVYAGMAIMVALVGFFGGGWAALFAGGLTLCLIPIPLVLFVKTSYRIVIYPKYWRLLKGEELMSEGSLLSLIGFARQASHTDSELLLVTRDHSFPLEVGVSEEEARFLTALVKR